MNEVTAISERSLSIKRKDTLGRTLPTDIMTPKSRKAYVK